ncbi:hypothetical protein EZV62_019853 [Acer yangbiense]|uniref:Uncharacterized protein n=1 Tax=Acer yangbiense TaxID=1000413 RepID=A0A5C7HCD1_9ROSI|nr:hypothetical protein EZV62_019853 [Acer yangbiense]
MSATKDAFDIDVNLVFEMESDLKKRIDKYLEGDEEVIPSIFEAILSRKLSGKHEENDNESLEEMRHKTDHHQDQEIDSEED